jgi:DNA-binding response OmpR family regulator
MMRALIVDDDLALADVVSFTLRRAGFEVVEAHDGMQALERWKAETPDIIILDLNLPKLSGLEVCQSIRAESNVPIIILSVRDDDDDIVNGLKFGADDYIVKPFSPRQLVARIDTVLRRSGAIHSDVDHFKIDGFTLDAARGEIFSSDETRSRLTPLENKLLQTLMINNNQVLVTESLIDHVWGPGGGDRAMLKQLIYRLRSKVEKIAPDIVKIESLPGMGYSLVTSHKPDGKPSR